MAPLPSPNGPLSLSMPSRLIEAANKEVRQQQRREASGGSGKSSKRGPYRRYLPAERAQIGKYGVQHGTTAAKRKFSRKLGVKISYSTVQGIVEAYRKETSRKRLHGDDNDDEVICELPEKKRGKPVLLGDKLDSYVQSYIKRLRQSGGTISTAIVIAGALGIIKRVDQTLLRENGGHISLTASWGKSLLRRMNFTKRRGTTKTGVSPEEFMEVKRNYLQSIIEVVQMENIPIELIFNWDQTGLNLVPTPSWTMEKRGSKRVEIKGLNDKRQITGVFCGTICGDFLPFQLIYGGKTHRCHPSFSFPSDWVISHSSNHWSNESTMLEYIHGIIIPYVDGVRERLGVGKEQAALAIYDHFKGQLTQAVTDVLEENNIQTVLVPATCTDRLQPMDLSVNKSAKNFLRSEFQNWYAEQLAAQDDDELVPVDLSSSRMKCVGAQWLVRLFDHLSGSPDIINNGFIASGIPHSIDAGVPYLAEEYCDNDSSDNEYTDDSEE